MNLFNKGTQKRLAMAKILVENTNEGMAVTDIDGKIKWINGAFTQITGYTSEEILGENPRVLKSKRHDKKFYKDMWNGLIQNGDWKGEIWNRRKNGEIYLEWLKIFSIKNEKHETTDYVCIFKDLTDSNLQFKVKKRPSYYDPLTDLPNRYLSADRLKHCVAHAKKNKKMVAVMVMDLDRFKRVNETLGYPLGDVLLQKISTRLLKATGTYNTIGRLGGDEFIIVLEDVEHMKSVVESVHQIFNAVKDPITLKEYEMNITMSMGISCYPQDADNIEDLIRYAEMAMYRAKEKGKNTYQIYNQIIKNQMIDVLKMENNIIKALKQEEFILYYQPQMDIKTGKIIGAEALIRWNHPIIGFMGPDQFIPVAEDTGLIIPLGEWVLKKACTQIKAFHEKGMKDLSVAINLSTLQFQQKDLIHIVKNVLEETQIDPKFLELEMTETNAMLDPNFTIDTLEKIHKMGIKVAIDDFGTGYSSLAYFKNLPIQKIKIDQSFIKDFHRSKNSAIVLAIIQMGKSLGVKVVAEGVEDQEQFEKLKEYGCDMLQGYFCSPPLCVKEFEKIYKQSSK